ncbi:ABZJ_00895 family protein [uncultured Psychrobacter sp.]|uniref:ABZJ_00895 family protein n=1 Tax=uncultured Psychrobacter sp. TaxID=259303 RepID=UPI003457BD85
MSRRSPITPNQHKDPAQSKRAQQHSKTGILQYVGFFAVGYLLASAIFMIVQLKFPLNPYLVTIIAVFVGAYIGVLKFTKHQQRALTISEINRLTFGGTGAVWTITAIYFLAVWLWLFDAANRAVFMEMTMQQPLPLIAALVMILVVTLVGARISILIVNRLLDPKRKTF